MFSPLIFIAIDKKTRHLGGFLLSFVTSLGDTIAAAPQAESKQSSAEQQQGSGLRNVTYDDGFREGGRTSLAESPAYRCDLAWCINPVAVEMPSTEIRSRAGRIAIGSLSENGTVRIAPAKRHIRAGEHEVHT